MTQSEIRSLSRQADRAAASDSRIIEWPWLRDYRDSSALTRSIRSSGSKGFVT